MGRLFENIIEGATAGGLIGAALDGLFIAGSPFFAGPVGLRRQPLWLEVRLQHVRL